MAGGFTALVTACMYGHPECVRRLLGAGTRTNDVDRDDRTELMRASSQSHAECARLLLEVDAGVLATDRTRITALYFGREHTRGGAAALRLWSTARGPPPPGGHARQRARVGARDGQLEHAPAPPRAPPASARAPAPRGRGGRARERRQRRRRTYTAGARACAARARPNPHWRCSGGGGGGAVVAREPRALPRARAAELLRLGQLLVREARFNIGGEVALLDVWPLVMATRSAAAAARLTPFQLVRAGAPAAAECGSSTRAATPERAAGAAGQCAGRPRCRPSSTSRPTACASSFKARAVVSDSVSRRRQPNL
eukprot:CAMPEP_0180060486 /NCGR_PEP_ID=MMETSP0985-20121206/6085_1 /TAXON_ID=483367 /ORGANISM="non described non described, Strain CCMP 2436" /LENGTH=312 /DNA_ID=CAMNT_0021990547 /DNA_START=59 /DNA_END=999 /DNA_ORIENTATION=+